MAAGRNGIPPEKRDAILADARAGGKSLTQIAKDHGVGKSTVHKMVKDAGMTNAFDRTQTEQATRAHAIDARARREQLKLALLGDAERLRARAWDRYEVVVDSRTDGPQTMTLDLPPLQDVRAAYAAIGIAIDKSVRLDQYDSTDSDVDAKSMIGDLAEGIRKWAHANPEPEGAETEG
jgi:transposase-like protein